MDEQSAPSLRICGNIPFNGLLSRIATKSIAAPAPEFAVQDDERKIALDQFRGKIVVLNFWASWCPPCITETPSLVAMQERLRE